MLQLVLGGSGSGKTTLLYHRIRARAEAGQKSILLVPEQFTSSTEGRIYRELGDALSGMVESFSFTSLAEKILSVEGGAAVQTLSDAGRAVLVRRALEELQENVHYYYRNRRSAAFCQMAAETIDELKSAGLPGQQLADLAKGCGAESGKLGELALIFQGYETLLARSAELEKILAICEEVKAELREQGVTYSDTMELGIMIETPAAAIISDRLAPMVDFFSVGTNDLTQYTLACDRQNPDIEPFIDTHHEAILRLIEMSARNAHANGAWIGICGELAADTTLTETFLRMGIDELSVSPAFVLKVRDAVRNVDLRK